MDDGRTGLVVLLLGDPHVLEGGEGGQDGSSDPDGEFPFRRSDDLDPHSTARAVESRHLLLHPVLNSRVHGAATGEDDVGVQVTPEICLPSS